MSPYTVSDGAGSKFTTAVYNYLYAKAKARLDRENPGLATEDYDHAHALLVCHMFAVKLGDANKTSESLGDYSYSASSKGSSYLEEYKALLSSVGSRTPSSNVSESRADIDMDDFDLDQHEIPKFPEE
jgi:hypothetical protein